VTGRRASLGWAGVNKNEYIYLFDWYMGRTAPVNRNEGVGGRSCRDVDRFYRGKASATEGKATL
jgi:hypothetical protein